MSELPITQISSELVEGVPYSYSLSNHRGYAVGGPNLDHDSFFTERHRWMYEYEKFSGTLRTWREDQPDIKLEVFRDILHISELSFCFNIRMEYFVVYIIDDTTYYYTYDILTNTYMTRTIGKLIATPRASISSIHIDNKLQAQVVIGYTKENSLYVRLEKDRYGVEYKVKDFDNKVKLVSLSYTDCHRFQYDVLEAL